jgi:hypothetical protein
MKSGYKIYWTDYALNELEKTIEFLEENWTEKEIFIKTTINKIPHLVRKDFWVGKSGENAKHFRKSPSMQVFPNGVRNPLKNSCFKTIL